MGHLSRAGLRALPVIAAIALGGCTTGPSGTPASAGAASPPAAAASAAAPGTHILHAEFVASDHYPFDPRVVTPDVVFTVQP